MLHHIAGIEAGCDASPHESLGAGSIAAGWKVSDKVNGARAFGR
jgi:hypothetical protein